MTGTNLQGTNIISMIVPTNHADTYATHDSFYGKGGWREVDTLDARNNIPEERRRIGMVVYVRETFKAYLLKNSLSNAGWVPFNIDDEEYITKDEFQEALDEALENYSTKDEVQSALSTVENNLQTWVTAQNYQGKTDNSLQTTAKTIVGAINELNAKPHIDTYSKAEEDALLALKADKTEIVDAYTKNETDAIAAELQTDIDKVAEDLQHHIEDAETGYVTNAEFEREVTVREEADTEIMEAVNGKAEIGASYTKVESDAKYLTEHQSLADYYTKDEVDEIISDIPVSDNVYTKDETDALLTGKIDKYVTLPTEGIEVGTIAQYTGKTTGPYTRGYFYKYMGETGIEFTPIQNEGAPECTTVATISVEDLTALLDTICEDRPFKAKDIVRGQIGYHNITSVYSFSATTDDGRFFSITYPIADLQEAGFTFEPLLGPGQGLKFACNLNETAWVQTDVQPSPSVEEIAALVEESDVFVPTDEYEQKCAQYEADIAALQEENEALQTTISTMQTTLDYVYEIVTQPHYDVLPDEEP